MPNRPKKVAHRTSGLLARGRRWYARIGGDNWLVRFANISQPLLLLLAFVGYMLTVRPVFQKELLSEQIAAKEMELSRLKRMNDGLNLESNALRSKVKQSSEKLSRIGLLIYHDSFVQAVESSTHDRRLNCAQFMADPTLVALSASMPAAQEIVSEKLASGVLNFAPDISAYTGDIWETYISVLRSELEQNHTAFGRADPDRKRAMQAVVDRANRDELRPKPAVPDVSPLCHERQLSSLYYDERLRLRAFMNLIKDRALNTRDAARRL